jgi:GH15 family glucan-1,4-alpha-glucosidase
MEALWVAACPDEANKFFTFLANAAGSGLQGDADLQIMFGIGGEWDLSERELPHLAGWRGSRPVRVGTLRLRGPSCMRTSCASCGPVMASKSSWRTSSSA